MSDFFDVKHINVLSLKKKIDCEIALQEIIFNSNKVKKQIDECLGDEIWERSARSALEEMEHKGRLVTKKLASLPNALPLPDFARSAITFKNAAKVVLDKETLEKIAAHIALVKESVKQNEVADN